MSAADPAKQDKDYLHHQAIRGFPVTGNHCSSIYYYRLTWPLLISYEWNHTVSNLYIWLLYLFWRFIHITVIAE